MVIYLEKYRKAKVTRREDRARVDLGNDIARIQALVTQY